MNPKITYTGKQVIRAGEELLNEEITDHPEKFESAMNIMSFWRFCHETPLEKAFEILKETTLKKDNTAIFAKRLKRHASIVAKLRRFRDMKLKNMQDIGGCRAIVSTPKKLEQVVRELKKRPEMKDPNGKLRFKDYIKKPKDDGYRGYHLIGKFKDDHDESKNIEIQIRTTLQHDWATALEIVDLFTNQALKSNQGDKDWKMFFANISEQFAVMENIHFFNTLQDEKKLPAYIEELEKNDKAKKSCIEVQELTEKLKVVEKFVAFANSLKIIDGHIEKSPVDGYVLVEVDTKKKTVKSTLFTKEYNEEASNMYVAAEKNAAEQKEIVVALVSSTALGGIKEAYPNYFADSKDFLTHLLLVTRAKVKPQKNIFSRIFG